MLLTMPLFSSSLDKREEVLAPDSVNKCIDGSPQPAQSAMLMMCLSTAGKPKTTRSKRTALGDRLSYSTPSEACLARVRASAMVASRRRGPLPDAEIALVVWNQGIVICLSAWHPAICRYSRPLCVPTLPPH